jgi:site-specific DNA-methyltransferase (adenine-specific)
MNSTNDKLENKTPHFGNTLLGAVPSVVYNEDCVEGMKRYPDKYFDLAIVDPPYGSNIMAKNKFQRHKTKDTTYRNEKIPSEEYWEQLYRVSKEQIIWGCQYMMPFLKPTGSFIVWDKKADPDLHNMSSCDIAWYSKRKKIKTFRGHWCGAVKFENEPTIHIHQKPVGLYKWLLKNYALEGMKILDTHLGSGSSRIAAYDMGFDFTAFEIDSTYYERQEKRFIFFLSQLKMF